MGCVIIIAILAVGAALDWVVWQRHDAAISAAKSVVGARGGDLLGWPFGREYRVTLETVPTNEQLQSLEALNHPPRGSVVGVMVRTCEAEEDDMRRISAALHACAVFQVCDGERVYPPNE